MNRIDPKQSATNPPRPSHPPAKSPDREPPTEEHEGATEAEVDDRSGPGAGYDDEPEQVEDKGGVA